jgi:hypothetical protein
MPKTVKRSNNQKRKTQKGGIFNYLREKFRINPQIYEKHIINRKFLEKRSKNLSDIISKDKKIKIYEKKKQIIKKISKAFREKKNIVLDNELETILKSDSDLMLFKKQVDYYLDNLAQERQIKSKKTALLEEEIKLNKEIFGDENEEGKRPESYSTPLSVYNNSIDKEILRKQQKLNKTPIVEERVVQTPIFKGTPDEIRLG